MRDKVISATDAARRFSDVLDQVQFRDVCYAIERGKKVVARLVPPATPEGLPLAELNALIAALPPLDPTDAKRWQGQQKAIRKSQKLQVRKWV